MRIEIHRTLMAVPPLPDGRRAVSYNVYVPLEDCPDQSKGHTMLCRDGVPGHRDVMNFAEATWILDLERGHKRLGQWFDHEKAAERLMLEWLHAKCPETRGITRWPLFWTEVDLAGTPPGDLTRPIAFDWSPVHVPGSTTLANCNRHLPEPERARARRATCMALDRRYTVLNEQRQPVESLVSHPGDRERGYYHARKRARADIETGRLPKGSSVVTAWDAWRQCPGDTLETTAPSMPPSDETGTAAAQN